MANGSVTRTNPWQKRRFSEFFLVECQRDDYSDKVLRKLLTRTRALSLATPSPTIIRFPAEITSPAGCGGVSRCGSCSRRDRSQPEVLLGHLPSIRRARAVMQTPLSSDGGCLRGRLV